MSVHSINAAADSGMGDTYVAVSEGSADDSTNLRELKSLAPSVSIKL